MTLSDFDSSLQEKVAFVEHLIYLQLPTGTDDKTLLEEAMNYSVMAGGKRIRPLLMAEAYSMFGGTQLEQIAPFLAAIELIHTYSLVHDDLPALDGDELRRGRATTWKKYGETVGVLAGDSLLNYAFEIMLGAIRECVNTDPVFAGRMVKAADILGKKAGRCGMLAGQMADSAAEGNPSVTMEDILYIHEHKTGALLEGPLMAGAYLAGADNSSIEALERIGSLIGLAFQIQDDILDVTSSDEVLGKPVGSDESNAKQTYVTLVGLEQAKKDTIQATGEAIRLLEEFGKDSEFLKLLFESLVSRKF